MSLVVSVKSASEALGWRTAMIVLAVERVRPLFAALGLPDAIVAAPGALVAGAEDFWRYDEELARAVAADRAHTGPDERRIGTIAVFNRAIAPVTSSYPQDALDAFAAWAARHYVDEAARANLFTWSQVLLAAVLRGASVSLPEPDRAAFDAAVADRIGTAPEGADKAALKAVDKALPGPIEARLAEREPELSGLALEGLRETLRNERTHRALAALATGLADRDGFVAWARVQAQIAGIPADQVRWP